MLLPGPSQMRLVLFCSEKKKGLVDCFFLLLNFPNQLYQKSLICDVGNLILIHFFC